MDITLVIFAKDARAAEQIAEGNFGGSAKAWEDFDVDSAVQAGL